MSERWDRGGVVRVVESSPVSTGFPRVGPDMVVGEDTASRLLFIVDLAGLKVGSSSGRHWKRRS